MQAVTEDTTDTTDTTQAPPRLPSLLTLARLTTASVREPARCPVPPGRETPLFWTSAALIGCLLLSAGRRTTSGLALDLPYRLLTREFGPGRVARFEDVDFPAALTHEPTRRFLRETGLPEDTFPLLADTDGMALPTLAEYYGTEFAAGPPAHLVRLGRLPDGADVVVDGATGGVASWHPADGTGPRPLTPDVSTLVFSLWLLHRAAAMEAVAGFEPT
ncbi:SUKH-4 family immunity protein [Streptomyces sp. WAC 04229]|uniref:SUKH-4 family immunity protein n=1 Tax=Streptomyces sp. WAC 04229 TaxID=2203206 RepID=UPI003D72D2F9